MNYCNNKLLPIYSVCFTNNCKGLIVKDFVEKCDETIFLLSQNDILIVKIANPILNLKFFAPPLRP